MVWIDWRIFTRRWLERAERGDRIIDDGDRFIALWMAFNGWMSGKFTEAKTDRQKIESVKKMQDFRDTFAHLREGNLAFRESLGRLEGIPVVNMQFKENREQVFRYDGTFESLMEVIYRVRNNLFHGRKNIDEDKKDIELVSLAYRILLPLFKAYLSA